ncbi:MAG: FecR domain-containing protein [Elusimicrobiota bacterium]|jgi:hypothetical protein
MNQDNDNEFWSKTGDSLKPRLSEAQWTAQRARIMGRLAQGSGAGRLAAWVAAAALACLAGLGILLPWGKSKPAPEGQTVTQAPVQISSAAPAAAAGAWDSRITMTQGTVTFFVRGSTEGVPAVEGMPLEEGDRVRTGADGRAELALSAESIIDLGPVSAITLSDLRQDQTLLGLDVGTLVAKLSWKLLPGRQLSVVTPTAVCAVRGTEFGVEVQEGGGTAIGVFDEGRVAVRTAGDSGVEETMLEPRQEVRVPAGAVPETEARDGRRYLRVGELSSLKPQQERMNVVRERPQALAGAWKPMALSEREQARGRVMSEHQGRMQAMPLEQRRSMQERVRQSQPGQAGPGDRGPSHDSGQRRQDGGRSQDRGRPGEEGARKPEEPGGPAQERDMPPDSRPRQAEPGQRLVPESGQRPGTEPGQDREPGAQGDRSPGGMQERQGPERGQAPGARQGPERQQGAGQRQGPERRQGPDRRPGGNMRPPGGQHRPQGGGQRRPAPGGRRH